MAGLADRIFNLPAPPSTPEQQADKIRLLEANATSALRLTKFWRGWDNPAAASGETARMNECLDALLELGVGH